MRNSLSKPAAKPGKPANDRVTRIPLRRTRGIAPPDWSHHRGDAPRGDLRGRAVPKVGTRTRPDGSIQVAAPRGGTADRRRASGVSEPARPASVASPTPAASRRGQIIGTAVRFQFRCVRLPRDSGSSASSREPAIGRRRGTPWLLRHDNLHVRSTFGGIRTSNSRPIVIDSAALEGHPESYCHPEVNKIEGYLEGPSISASDRASTERHDICVGSADAGGADGTYFNSMRPVPILPAHGPLQPGSNGSEIRTRGWSNIVQPGSSR